MARFLWICLGGAIGTAARYGISIGSRQLLGGGFPYGTLTVNVIGSFLLSVIMYVGLNTDLMSETTRFALGTGVMGGFTTYSSFNYETLQLVQERSYRTGALTVFVTLRGCFVAGWLGLATAKWAVGK